MSKKRKRRTFDLRTKRDVGEQAALGVPVRRLAKKLNVAESVIYTWKNDFQAKRLRGPEDVMVDAMVEATHRKIKMDGELPMALRKGSARGRRGSRKKGRVGNEIGPGIVTPQFASATRKGAAGMMSGTKADRAGGPPSSRGVFEGARKSRGLDFSKSVELAVSLRLMQKQLKEFSGQVEEGMPLDLALLWLDTLKAAVDEAEQELKVR